MPRLSPLPTSLLPPRWQLESAEKLHLVLELDAELLVRPPPRLCHQGDGLGRAGAVRVLDEVRVPGRDPGAADPLTLEPAGLEHSARRQLVLRVLEDAAERALVRRLYGLPQRLEPRDVRLDLLLRTRCQLELRKRDDLAVA